MGHQERWPRGQHQDGHGAQTVSVGPGAYVEPPRPRSPAAAVRAPAACLADPACGAVDWDPQATQTCLWRAMAPRIQAVESACGKAPHPAGCHCYKKTPLPSPPPPPGPCTSDEDCQLNGECKNPGTASASCSCFGGWKGFDCVSRVCLTASQLYARDFRDQGACS